VCAAYLLNKLALHIQVLELSLKLIHCL
jgi:hypothetical protein